MFDFCYGMAVATIIWWLAAFVWASSSPAQTYDGYLGYSYPNGAATPPEVVPAPPRMTRGLDDRDYGYTDDMGWHDYRNGTPDPGGNCWASFKC